MLKYRFYWVALSDNRFLLLCSLQIERDQQNLKYSCSKIVRNIPNDKSHIEHLFINQWQWMDLFNHVNFCLKTYVAFTIFYGLSKKYIFSVDEYILYQKYTRIFILVVIFLCEQRLSKWNNPPNFISCLGNYWGGWNWPCKLCRKQMPYILYQPN